MPRSCDATRRRPDAVSILSIGPDRKKLVDPVTGGNVAIGYLNRNQRGSDYCTIPAARGACNPMPSMLTRSPSDAWAQAGVGSDPRCLARCNVGRGTHARPDTTGGRSGPHGADGPDTLAAPRFEAGL